MYIAWGDKECSCARRGLGRAGDLSREDKRTIQRLLLLGGMVSKERCC